MKKLKELLVSIDGGGTKTIIQIATLDRKILGKEQGGPANIASDTEESWNSVTTTLQILLNKIQLHPTDVRLYGGGGFAGAEVPSALEKFMHISHGFENLLVRTDAYTSCLGAHKGKDGAIVAVGTGTVAYAIANKNSVKLSGWGFPQDDQGGGAWMGLQLISNMLRAMDGRAPKTRLIENIYTYLKQQNCDPMLWAVGATPTKFGSLAPWIIQEAKSGCSEANILLDEAASIISHLAESLLQGEFSDLPLCLLGGISEILMPRMSHTVKNHITPAQGTSLDGAFFLALEAYNSKKDN